MSDGFGEGISKGNQNPPNTSTERPALPSGSEPKPMVEKWMYDQLAGIIRNVSELADKHGAPYVGGEDQHDLFPDERIQHVIDQLEARRKATSRELFLLQTRAPAP